MALVVENEIGAAKKNAIEGTDPVRGFLNNFHLKMHEIGTRHWISLIEMNFDVPHGKIASSRTGEKVFPANGHSSIFLNQTPRQFFENVFRAFQKTGADFSKVKQLSASKSLEDRVIASRLALPAYIRLRSLGYTHSELTS